MMRLILLAIALIAVARFATYEYLDRTAKRDVIISAYKEHAIAACEREAAGVALGADWAQPASVKLTIGKQELDVYVWQTRNRLWNARYRNAYLYLTPGKAGATVYCEYDISNDVASVHRAADPIISTQTQSPTRG